MFFPPRRRPGGPSEDAPTRRRYWLWFGVAVLLVLVGMANLIPLPVAAALLGVWYVVFIFWVARAHRH